MQAGSVTPEYRAKIACWVGLVLHLVLFAVVLALGAWGNSQAIVAEGRHLLGGVLIWLVMLIYYTQKGRAAAETLETEQLRRERAGESAAIFEIDDEELLIARRRLRWVERWVLPIGALLTVAYHVVGTFLYWGWDLGLSVRADSWNPVDRPALLMAVIAGAGFVCFLFSRYAGGMGRQESWRMLRAGSIYMFGNAVICVVLVAVLGLAHFSVPVPERVLAYVIRIAMLILGAEFLINMMMDVYRPRVPGVEIRPAFESRLLGLFSEPEGIARSIADAINYQFGFEVSGTWFYQLLRKAVLPLIVFGAVCIVGLSSLVVIDADEMAVIERFGTPLQESHEEALGPGLYFKYPWPVDVVRKARVLQIGEAIIGEKGVLAEKQKEAEDHGKLKLVLWTEEHKLISPDTRVIVATPQLESLSESGDRHEDDRPSGPVSRSVPISLMNTSLLVQYRINDLYKYLYGCVEPERVLEDIAWRELINYSAGVDIDRVMGVDRDKMAADLRQRVEERCRRQELGFEIVYLGLQGMHPPPEENVASTYQKVVSAEQVKETFIQYAQGEAENLLTTVAGDGGRARRLDEAIQELVRLESSPDPDPAEVEKARAEVNVLMLGDPARGIAPVSGEAAKKLSEARAMRMTIETNAQAKAESFSKELVAYKASPEIYRMRKYLRLLGENLRGVRKWVIAADTNKSKLVILFEAEEGTGLEFPGIVGESQ